ncbi:hypothetical protein GE21DRAFT_1284584 [Neurospora crassa]|nr:hypothetical protein GE21DRAFT_1284584 [Neurospora crassa]
MSLQKGHFCAYPCYTHSRFESSHVNHHHRNFSPPCSCQTAVHSLIPINVAASAQDVPIMTALAAPSSLAV